MKNNYDVIIIGTGVAGLYNALNLPDYLEILMVTKAGLEESDSFLAQGGICVMKDEHDFDCYLEDTMKAGHYENSRDSVQVMIQSSRDIIRDLIRLGVDFEKKDGELHYTREGAHSTPRILHHKDITGKEITSKLLSHVLKRKNITLLDHTEMIDLTCRNNNCCGTVLRLKNSTEITLMAHDIILATGGIGGRYQHSTNYPHLTGDALYLAEKYHITLKHMDYIQIHPTTLYSTKPGRRFLISESVRGEGGVLYNKNGERFVDELLPRDLLTQAIHKQMELDNTPYVMLDMRTITECHIKERFPNICQHCLEEGFDVTKECIPIVPAQHYFMGGIEVDLDSKTSMNHLYAIGETSCNGVHGANRLASNSLLESLVFAKRAAADMMSNRKKEKMIS